MTGQLKPCPCGKEPHLYTDSFDNGMNYGVECRGCYLHTPYSDSVIKAISDWNDHPMHKKDEGIVRLQTGFIRIIHEVKAGATDVEVLAICREMLGFKEKE